jgi:NAD(P)-dependent dehydrogenase (short-subunit alcohol dehydrogenase family)
MSVDLTGQVALVTGATSGLGRRFALTLAAVGATVAAAGRRKELLDEVVEEITQAGGSANPVQLDVRDAEAVERALVEVTKTVGVPTILVNAAGIVDAERATRLTVETVDALLDTNLRGPFLLSCAFARQLIERKLSGRIVNVSSMAAFVYDGNAAALYSTTKGGVNRMTEALAVEWARFHINVNAIAPGYFETEMLTRMIARAGPIDHALPRKRVGVPWQLDSTLLYLVDPASESVTGTIIRVDDGQLTR